MPMYKKDFFILQKIRKINEKIKKNYEKWPKNTF